MPGKETTQGRQERRRQQRQQELARQQKRQAAMRNWTIFGGAAVVVVVIAAISFFIFKPSSTSAAQQPGDPIDGISCQAEMLNYHIHAHLTLYRNGKKAVLPQDVGIPFSAIIASNAAISPNGQPYCLYWLHTHDTRGVVHIESPTQQTYTLGQFFDIWRKTALWDAQGTLAASAGLHMDASFVDAINSAKASDIHAFVGGKPVSDYHNIPLTAHALITIELGTPVVPPTTHFAFGANE